MNKREAELAGFTPLTQRRFYTIGQDVWVSKHRMFEFANKNEVEPPWPESLGTHQLNAWDFIGLGRLNGIPHFVTPKRGKTELDLYHIYGGWVVSDRARRMFEEFDAAAFEWGETHTTRGKDGAMALGPYWRMDVIRVVDCVDDRASAITGNFPENGIFSSYISLQQVKFDLESLNDVHAFRVRRGFGPIFDSAIADEIRARKYRGMSFSPLQTPTFDERRTLYKANNADFWLEREPSKSYWDSIQADIALRYQNKLALGEV